MASTKVVVHSRARYVRLAAKLVVLVVRLRPVIGDRLAFALADAALRLVRVEYRVGSGEWRPVLGRLHLEVHS